MAKEPTTKKFGSSNRTVPHHTEKSQKWYPAEDEAKPKQVSASKATGQDAAMKGTWLCVRASVMARGFIRDAMSIHWDHLGPRQHAA